MASGPAYRTSTGAKVRLGQVLGQGGEGAVSAIEGDSTVAAKIYWPQIAAERQEKIVALVDTRWYAVTDFVTFPIEALFELPSGKFAGFTMRRLGGKRPVHQLYSPTGRKTEFPTATFPFLLRAALNIARAVASVHATGCVIGDINHSGVLVASDATVSLIDSDSFQVNYRGKLFRCKVGVPEFTPPELQGQRPDQVTRTPNHDSFALGVLVFYTLMMGRHPFAGRYTGSGEAPTIEQAIAECRFAYSARRANTQMEPPPNVPTLDDLPLALRDAFERAFGPAGMGQGRPAAAEWVALLAAAEKEIIPCGLNTTHHYFKAASTCPWCRMERAWPGFVAFSVTLAPGPGAAVDLVRLIAAVRGVPDPGPTPALASVVPPTPIPAPSLAAFRARRARMTRFALAAIGTVFGIALVAVGGVGPILALMLFGASVILVLRAPPQYGSVGQSNAAARKAWRDAEHTFAVRSGNEAFRRARQNADLIVQEALKLQSEEARRRAELEGKREEAQRRRYLERFSIDKAKIKGVGSTRKITLKAYGIETCADVEAHRIEAVPGLGASSLKKLMAWRTSVEAEFVFDPRQPIASNDLDALRSDIAQRRSNVETRLKQALAALKKLEQDIKRARTQPDVGLVTVWSALKQAEADEAYLAALDAKVRKPARAGVAILVVAAILAAVRSGVFPSPTAELPQGRIVTPTSAGEDILSIKRPLMAPATSVLPLGALNAQVARLPSLPSITRQLPIMAAQVPTRQTPFGAIAPQFAVPARTLDAARSSNETLPFSVDSRDKPGQAPP